MIVAVDVGYSYTKVYAEGLHFKFRSTVDEGIAILSNSINVVLDKEKFTIGENSGKMDSTVNKIESPNFNLLLKTAIGLTLEKKKINNEKITLVTGLPLGYFEKQKNDLIKRFEKNRVEINIKNQEYAFNIDKVIVYPQGMAHLALEPEAIKGDVCVVDIGGYTVDVTYFSNGTARKCTTFQEGMNTISKEIVDTIREKHGVAYEPVQAEQLLDRREITKNIDGIKSEVIDIGDILDTIMKKYWGRIYNQLQSFKPFMQSKAIYMGGGALRLNKLIFNQEEINEDSIYLNSKAYLAVGKLEEQDG